METKRLIIITLFATLTAPAFAHSGRTDKYGCHTEKATGIYHCHNAKPAEPVISTPVAPIVENTPITHGIVEVAYDGFTVWADCNKHASYKFRYNAQRDSGNEARSSQFKLDADLPSNCQPSSSASFGKSYDRGHLVPANHLDNSKTAIEQSNYMTNILPQTSTLNRGAWLASEEIIECLRDTQELLVLGGAVWDDESASDFVQSHNIKTPRYFWKVIVAGVGVNERAIGWYFPNTREPTRKKLDNYLMTIASIEEKTGEHIPVSESIKTKKWTTSWAIPKGCNKS